MKFHFFFDRPGFQRAKTFLQNLNSRQHKKQLLSCSPNSRTKKLMRKVTFAQSNNVNDNFVHSFSNLHIHVLETKTKNGESGFSYYGYVHCFLPPPWFDPDNFCLSNYGTTGGLSKVHNHGKDPFSGTLDFIIILFVLLSSELSRQKTRTCCC